MGPDLRSVLAELFRNTSHATLATIRDRYAMDFQICGYTDTGEIISDILEEKRRLLAFS